MAGTDSHDTGAAGCADGSLLYVSDEDGWFQVIRRSPDGRDGSVLTDGEREHGEPVGGFGYVPLASPDGTPLRPHRGPRRTRSTSSSGLGGGRAAQARSRPAAEDAADRGCRRRRPQRISPLDGVWRAIGWLADGAWVAAIGESETRPQDLWLLPVPGVAPDGSRPRQVTDSRPAVLAAALAPGRVAQPASASTFTARDGLRIEGTLWRPATATGKRGGRRVPTIVYPHGGPTWQAYRALPPFKLLLANEGYAFLDVDFRGSTGYGRAFRAGQPRRMGPRRRPGHRRCRARWAAEQPWSDGRLGDLRRVVRRLHGPVRARRGAGAVVGRRRPVRGLRDRRELPAWRPASAGSTCTR